MKYFRRQALHLHRPVATLCTISWETVVGGYSHKDSNVKWQENVGKDDASTVSNPIGAQK